MHIWDRVTKLMTVAIPVLYGTPQSCVRWVWVWAGRSCSVDRVEGWLSQISVLTRILEGWCRRWCCRALGGQPWQEDYGKVKRHKRNKKVLVEGPPSPGSCCMSCGCGLSWGFQALSIREARSSLHISLSPHSTLVAFTVLFALNSSLK